jgi:esterase FrsA
MTTNPPLTTPNGASIFFEGAPLETGCQPAVIYFALSARMSLCQEPFNQPVLEWAKAGCRVFSWDLPFHDEEHTPQEAIALWAEQFAQGGRFIDEFIDLSLDNIDFLIKQGLINPTQLGVAGLSRGGYIAVQLAARSPMIQSIVGFAPLTDPKPIDEFSHYPDAGVEELSLSKLIPNLIHKRLRFYIGNRDIRVSTDACYAFMRALIEAAFLAGDRSPPIELIIYPSIGHKGHGTPFSIFTDGANWLQKQVIINHIKVEQ